MPDTPGMTIYILSSIHIKWSSLFMTLLPLLLNFFLFFGYF